MRDPAQYVGEEKGGAAHSPLLVVAHEAGEGERGEEKETEGESGCRLAGCLPACLSHCSVCLFPSLPPSFPPSYSAAHAATHLSKSEYHKHAAAAATTTNDGRVGLTPTTLGMFMIRQSERGGENGAFVGERRRQQRLGTWTTAYRTETLLAKISKSEMLRDIKK